jgi:glycosyltransferase involved in cell wall biosynthesis
VQAIDRLRVSIPAIRLVFLGMRNPNPDIPDMRMAGALRELSDRLGLTGEHVFFNEGWVPYDHRGSYLMDAQVAVSTHLANVETHFAFRTRVLDYLWAGLPMVLTGGDALSDEIAARGLGVAVPAGDPDAIAAALSQLIASPPDRQAIRAYASRYRWDRVAGPLLAWCRSPWAAADNPAPAVPDLDEGPEGASAPANPVVAQRAFLQSVLSGVRRAGLKRRGPPGG